jgi:hypothetical protein
MIHHSRLSIMRCRVREQSGRWISDRASTAVEPEGAVAELRQRRGSNLAFRIRMSALVAMLGTLLALPFIALIVDGGPRSILRGFMCPTCKGNKRVLGFEDVGETQCQMTATPSTFISVMCGDGICGAFENRCRCPEDCP